MPKLITMKIIGMPQSSKEFVRICVAKCRSLFTAISNEELNTGLTKKPESWSQHFYNYMQYSIDLQHHVMADLLKHSDAEKQYLKWMKRFQLFIEENDLHSARAIYDAVSFNAVSRLSDKDTEFFNYLRTKNIPLLEMPPCKNLQAFLKENPEALPPLYQFRAIIDLHFSKYSTIPSEDRTLIDIVQNLEKMQRISKTKVTKEKITLEVDQSESYRLLMMRLKKLCSRFGEDYEELRLRIQKLKDTTQQIETAATEISGFYKPYTIIPNSNNSDIEIQKLLEETRIRQEKVQKRKTENAKTQQSEMENSDSTSELSSSVSEKPGSMYRLDLVNVRTESTISLQDFTDSSRSTSSASHSLVNTPKTPSANANTPRSPGKRASVKTKAIISSLQKLKDSTFDFDGDTTDTHSSKSVLFASDVRSIVSSASITSFSNSTDDSLAEKFLVDENDKPEVALQMKIESTNKDHSLSDTDEIEPLNFKEFEKMASAEKLKIESDPIEPLGQEILDMVLPVVTDLEDGLKSPSKQTMVEEASDESPSQKVTKRSQSITSTTMPESELASGITSAENKKPKKFETKQRRRSFIDLRNATIKKTNAASETTPFTIQPSNHATLAFFSAPSANKNSPNAPEKIDLVETSETRKNSKNSKNKKNNKNSSQSTLNSDVQTFTNPLYKQINPLSGKKVTTKQGDNIKSISDGMNKKR